MFELFVASCIAVAFMYLPGYLAFRALRLTNVVSLAAAPLASCAVYGLLPLIYYETGIPCSLLTVAVVPTLALAGAMAASLAFAARNGAPAMGLPGVALGRHGASGGMDARFDWTVLGLYVLAGLAVCSIVFIANLASPDAFFSRYDNKTHLNLIQSFIDSGCWSSLHPSRYGDVSALQNPYPNADGFYPATWHALGALVCLASGVSVTVASNALTAVVAALVFPAGMFLLIRTLFPGNRSAVIAGAFTTVAFATYPWVFPIKGPTFPNMLGYAVMVPFMALFIAWLENGLVRKRPFGFAAFILISFASMGLAHTNALFTAFVFLAAYGGHYLIATIRDSERVPDNRKTLVCIVAIALYLLVIVAFWAFCLTSSLFEGVVGYTHIENKPITQGVGGLLSLKLTINSTQWVMILLSAAGVFLCLKRKIWWLLIPVAYMAIAYVVARTSPQPFLTILVGLWYSLPYRVAACLCIFLMPVSALGLAGIVDGIRSLIEKRGESRSAWLPTAATAALVLLMAAVTFPTSSFTMAGHRVGTPFSSVATQMADIYGNDENRVYGAEEVAFVNRALEKIPEGALVINQPYDGSMFAYGVNHMCIYFRSTGIGSLKDEADTIRKSISEYGTNPKVREAVESVGAEYLLLLDQNVAYEDGIWLPQYTEDKVKNWSGIGKVNDDTPGFSVVLAEGDMRLYKIGE